MSVSPTERPPAGTVEVTMPDAGANAAIEVVAWLKRPGEEIAEQEAICLVGWEGQRAEIGSPAGGVLRMIALETGRPVAAGTALAVIDVGVAARRVGAPPGFDQTGAGAEAEEVPTELLREPPVDRSAPEVDFGEFLSPAVRRFAREHGIDPEGVEGSGRDGRVTLADLTERG